MHWIVYSLVAMICFSFMTIIFKKLTKTDLSSETINFYFFLFTTIGIFIFSVLRKGSFDLKPNRIPLFIILALIAVVANFASISAIKAAPNPGYVKGIQAVEIVLVTLMAYFIFNAEITPTKVIGIIISLIGLVFLSL